VARPRRFERPTFAFGGLPFSIPFAQICLLSACVCHTYRTAIRLNIETKDRHQFVGPVVGSLRDLFLCIWIIENISKVFGGCPFRRVDERRVRFPSPARSFVVLPTLRGSPTHAENQWFCQFASSFSESGAIQCLLFLPHGEGCILRKEF